MGEKSFLSPDASFDIGEIISTGAYIRRATIYINDASSFSARVGCRSEKKLIGRLAGGVSPINQTLDHQQEKEQQEKEQEGQEEQESLYNQPDS